MLMTLAMLVAAALASWYLSRTGTDTDQAPQTVDPVHRGFYLKSARILGTGPDGALLLVLGSGRADKGPGVFRTPEGIEVMGDTLWISDSGNDRVVKYRILRN